MRVMNLRAQVDRCITPERSEAFGEPASVRVSSGQVKTGNHRRQQGQGAQNILQVWPTSREGPREKISRGPAAMKEACSQSSDPERQD